MSEIKQKTILVIEDEKYLREMIALKLKESGYNVLPVESADKALEILKIEKPDLIWTDLLLPGLGGMEFIEKIKNDEITKNIPVIMVSVSGGPDTIERAFAVGVKDYIVKSQLTLDRIINKIELFLK